MLAKTKIEKILKKLRQSVNISPKRQVPPNIFNANMFFSSRGYLGGLKKKMLTWKVGGGCTGDMLAHGLILMRKYTIFGRVRGNILPLKALYRVVLEQM